MYRSLILDDNRSRLLVSIKNGMMFIRHGDFEEAIWIDGENVISLQTGRQMSMGTGEIRFRNGKLFVEAPEGQPPSKVRKCSETPAGLMNHGNQCYANAVVQALNCADVHKSLQALPEMDEAIATSFVSFALREVS